MQISVFGLGHIGLVTAAVLAEFGHTVWGVEIEPQVREMVRGGQAPFQEPGLEELLQQNLRAGRLLVTDNAARAVQHSAISLLCVGTPSQLDGTADLSAVERVLDEIGTVLQEKEPYHVVVLRSTVPPTAWQGLVARLAAVSGKEPQLDFGICANPEFLREGQAVADFTAPPFVVVGHDDAHTGYVVATLYDSLRLPLITTTPESAMLLKYTCNTWHALKIAFANEIGTVAAALGLDGAEVMRIFARDDRLNISSAYLRPGGPYGGPCLPKDVAALNALAAQVGTPVLSALPWSNRAQLDALIARAMYSPARRLAVVGLSFKPATSDLRESPAAQVIDALLEAGRDVRIYDPDVPPALARDYAPLLAEWDELTAWAEAWIMCKPELLLPGVQLSGEVLTWI